MDDLFVFMISFTMIFVVYLAIYFVKLKKKKLASMMEYKYLINKYKLDKKKINYKRIGIVICLLNAFIIAFVGTICTMIKVKVMWQLCIGFALLMVMIYSCYGILGNILSKK